MTGLQTRDRRHDSHSVEYGDALVLGHAAQITRRERQGDAVHGAEMRANVSPTGRHVVTPTFTLGDAGQVVSVLFAPRPRLRQTPRAVPPMPPTGSPPLRPLLDIRHPPIVSRSRLMFPPLFLLIIAAAVAIDWCERWVRRVCGRVA